MKLKVKQILLFGLLLRMNVSYATPIDELPRLVTEEKRIKIPHYRNALNPSIAYWSGNLLLSFREHNGEESYIGLVKLDDNFNPIGTPQLLETRFNDPQVPSRAEDARLIVVGDKLYAFFNDDRTPSGCGPRTMHVGEITSDGEHFYIKPEPFFKYDFVRGEGRVEKNWSPFQHLGELCCIYNTEPFRVLQILLGTNSTVTMSTDHRRIDWEWADSNGLRGGTPAILINDDEYLTFFHSNTWLGEIRQFFMGALIFSAHYPFLPKKISKIPLIGDNFYRWPIYVAKWGWGPSRVVYPGGLLMRGEDIYIVYGLDNHEVWVAKVNKNTLSLHMEDITWKKD